MKKTPLLIVVLVHLVSHVSAQNPYYDALTLKKYATQQTGTTEVLFNITKDNVLELGQLTRTYGTIPDTLPENEIAGRIEEVFRGNPFLSPQAQVQEGLLGTKKKSLGSKSIISSIGGTNVTTVADGLAKFLVERTKQELSITFFQDFKEFLDSDEAADFRILFPNTKNTLDAIDREIYQYASYLNTLRESFEIDLRSILDRLPTIVEKRVSDPEKEYILLALHIVNQLRSGEHPATVIENLANWPFSKNLKPVGEGFKFFRIISTSIQSKTPDQYWVSLDSLNLIFDQMTFKIYLGLIYELHGEDSINGKKVKDHLQQLADNYSTTGGKYQEFIRSIGLETQHINLAIKEIKRKKDAGEKVDSYFSLFNSTAALLQVLSEIKELPLAITPGGEFEKVVNVTEFASNLYLNLNDRKYNAAVIDLSNLLRELLGPKFTWEDKLIRYGTFMANVAQAENSSEVQAAIEAVALPVGSASIKRQSKSNIALNAYVGLSTGSEYNGETEKWRWTFGVSTPVGVAFSRGRYEIDNTNNKYNEKGSSTWFLSLVDIAAFSTFRFNDAETEELPEVTLANIFAPGLYYVRGLPNVPISLGLGGQLGPQIRELQPDVTPTNTGMNISFRFFVAVDIPLINFYTKSRNNIKKVQPSK